MSPPSTRYRGKTGQWAFLGHRVTGVLVFLFLLLHIVDVSLVRWPDLYNDVHAAYGNVVMRAFEVGLLFALLFHALNGLRIVAIDFLPSAARIERGLFTAVLAVTVVVGIPAGWVIMHPFFFGH
ncbi:MAG TPA: succinate dehydrogenase, cytochrome b556 subunit [Acidimicrobiales bacterium]|nr:succinate dehydrogenase, cytochrome b556 subunit [Acidimicrobiales bacterium]